MQFCISKPHISAKKNSEYRRRYKHRKINLCNELGIDYTLIYRENDKAQLWVDSKYKDFLTKQYIKISRYDKLTFGNENISLEALLAKNGIKKGTFYSRMRMGWSFSTASTIQNGGYTENQLKRHNKRDIAKFVKNARKRKYR